MLTPSRTLIAFCMALPFVHGIAAPAQEGTYAVKVLSPETALEAAQAAMAQCRKAGHLVAVAVVDRFGVVQVVLRDRLAGAHTISFATQKAWTAASFRMATATLAVETQAGRPMSAMRSMPGVLAAGGGLPIEAGGSLLGGIGVSGAPGGEADDACAGAGLKAIAESIEF
jgi:uncharacterized protein GlcG (DUF336 family)